MRRLGVSMTRSLGLLGVLWSSAIAGTALAACPCPGDFQLRAVGATTLEIPLAWDPVATATQYIIERSPSCDFSAATTYTTSAAVTAYGDTGKLPDDKYRFWYQPATSPSTISAGVTYNYRVRAQL